MVARDLESVDEVGAKVELKRFADIHQVVHLATPIAKSVMMWSDVRIEIGAAILGRDAHDDANSLQRFERVVHSRD